MKLDQQQDRTGSHIKLKRALRAALLFIPALIYLPTWWGNAAVPPGPEAYSDLLITHYPYLLYLRNSIITNLQIPLWSTLIHSGAPFAANPLAGVFYLPGWLAMLFPLPAGISLVAATHVVFGTWGMYRLLRHRAIGETGSIAGALGFGLMPKIAAHFGAGHITLIYALSWTPWLLYCGDKDQKGWKTGVIAGMIFLADPRWTVYAGALWITYDIAHRQIAIFKRLAFYIKASAMAVFVSAPLLFPMVEYIRLATRSDLVAGDIVYGSLPVTSLINAIIPGSGGNIEWYSYAGGVVLALFISQLFIKKLRQVNRFWIIWVMVSYLLAMGTWSGEIGWINRIPILNMLRVPARSLFLTGIGYAVIAGTVIDQISSFELKTKGQRAIHFGISAFGLSMAVGVGLLMNVHPLMALWGFAFLAASGALMVASDQFPSRKSFGWIFAGILLLDLLGAGLSSYQIQSKELRKPGEIYDVLETDEDDYRVYSPSFSVQQYLAAELDLEIADGVDPMQIAKYSKFMAEATGVNLEGYSVTIPPFRSGNPMLDNIDAVPDSELLGLLNVKYVVSAFEIDAIGLTPLSIEGTPKLYQNDNLMPRAWVEPMQQDTSKQDRDSIGLAAIVEKTANKIKIEAAGPGRLVISEVDYPGWQVYVDGSREPIEVSHGLLRSVLLSEGEHQVVFVFRPLWVYLGLVFAGIGWIFAAYIYIQERND